jgi:hypothetical protein
MQRTLEQNNRFHQLIALNCWDIEKKRGLVAKATGLRTVHSDQMEFEEMAMAISLLDQERREILARYMRVIGLCCSAINWTVQAEDGYMKIDYNSLNAYIKQYYHKENLNRLNAHQLNKLVISLKQIAIHKGVKL